MHIKHKLTSSARVWNSHSSIINTYGGLPWILLTELWSHFPDIDVTVKENIN
jgi:hypothetical protein